MKKIKGQRNIYGVPMEPDSNDYEVVALDAHNRPIYAGSDARYMDTCVGYVLLPEFFDNTPCHDVLVDEFEVVTVSDIAEREGMKAPW